MTNLVWNDYNMAITALPETTRTALMQRGFTHIMGNEVAAFESKLKTDRVDPKDPKSALKYSASEIAAMVHDRRNEKLAEMVAGELGTRSVGPRLPKAERLAREIAKENLIHAFDAKGKTKPKAADTAVWDGLVDAYLAKYGETVEKEVKRRMTFKTPDVDLDGLI